MNFDEKMSGIWLENHKQGINFSRLSRTFCHKQGQGFKVGAAPPTQTWAEYPSPGRRGGGGYLLGLFTSEERE